MLIVFLACAFLPFGGLAVVSYIQVANFFNQKNQRQLREFARLFGVDVFQRLKLLESELEIVAANVSGTEQQSKTLPELSLSSPKTQWTSLSVVTSAGQHRLFGSVQQLPV